jgi:hypothetical protein
VEGDTQQESESLQQGRALAAHIYDYGLTRLGQLNEDDLPQLRRDFPGLGADQVKDIVRQVLEAKRYERERIAWQALPHDLTVVVLALVTAGFNLRIATVVAVATLFLAEGVFQSYFHRGIGRWLGALVWLTYPAYALLGYTMLMRSYAPSRVVVGIVLAWGGPFVLGALARLLVQVMIHAQMQGQAARRQKRDEAKRTGQGSA